MARHEEPGRCGGGRGSDVLAGKPEHPERNADAVERQDLAEALVCCDRMKLPALLHRDHLARRGLGDNGIAAAVCRQMRKLNYVHQRGGTLRDLADMEPGPPPPWPAWQTAATVKWRRERDMQRGGWR